MHQKFSRSLVVSARVCGKKRKEKENKGLNNVRLYLVRRLIAQRGFF
jgi:hypothetical protein